MVDIQLFSPLDANTVALSASDSSSAVTLTQGGTSIRIFNAGPNVAFYAIGATPTAALPPGKGIPIPVGMVEVISRGESISQLAAICGTGETAELYISTGSGA